MPFGVADPVIMTHPVVAMEMVIMTHPVVAMEMGKNPNPARMNRTITQVLPRTKPNPNSNSVLSQNELVGTLIHFTDK